MSDKNIYTGKSIQIFEGVEAVKKRPAMYLGSTDEDGFHHLVWEIIDNALDEYLAGYCKQINVVLGADNFVSIEDDGRGIPVDIHPKTRLPTIETVFTYLHAGGKFDGETYFVSGGLHGVGSTVVNAMASYLKVTVYAKDKMYTLEFVNGRKTSSDLKESINPFPNKKQGTKVEFKPNSELFDDFYQFRKNLIEERLQQTAYINSGVKINFSDERINYQKKYFYRNGILSFLEKIVGATSNLQNQHTKVIDSQTRVENIKVHFAFRYTNTNNLRILSFCNNIRTIDGGAHEKGFKMAVTRVLKKIMKKYRYYDETKDKLETNDIINGIHLILVVLHPDPKFAGQTKTKLVNSAMIGLTSTFVGDELERFLLENPSEREQICKKVLQSMRLRIELDNKTKEFKVKNSYFESSMLPGKLADCASKKPEETELFIVEGDSAGGSAKLGRNRNFQAILPLKGKIINSEKVLINKLFANQEICDLISSVGFILKNNTAECGEHKQINCEVCGNKSFEHKRLRYHKIVIMTDADVDGSHIAVLLLTFMYRHIPGLIENNYVYLAQPPLYKFKVGKKVDYLYNEESLQEKIAETTTRYEIQRYKGLGEMNPGQLWETTMDPKRRTLRQVTVEDAQAADDIIQLLMGKEVEGRRNFILKNAKFVRDLDI